MAIGGTVQLIMEQHTVRRPLQSSFWHSTLHTNSSREGFSSSFQRTRVQHRCRAKGDEYFDEGAAQVRRLLDRDRKELQKEQEQKAEYDAEYSRPEESGSSSNGSNGASTSKASALEEELSSMKNPMQKAFKAPPKRGAFGSSGKSPFGSDSSSSIDRDMWANMEPVDIDEAPWWTQISFGQVAIVISFLLIIGLMLATTWVTVKLGGVHFNE